MKNYGLKRLVCILLVAVMMVGILPITADAYSWEFSNEELETKQIPAEKERIDNGSYYRFVDKWEDFENLFDDLDYEALETIGSLKVYVRNDLKISTGDLTPDDTCGALIDVPAGVNVSINMAEHTIRGDIDLTKQNSPQGFQDLLLFRLGKGAELSYTGGEDAVSLYIKQPLDTSVSAVRFVCQEPRASRNDPYPASVRIAEGEFYLHCETRSYGNGTLGTDAAYRGTVIADHVEMEIDDGKFTADGVVGPGVPVLAYRELTAFGTVISDPKLHLDKAPAGKASRYIENGHTVIDGGVFTSKIGYAIRHFDCADLVIQKGASDYLETSECASLNKSYHMNYPIIRGGVFYGKLGYTGFTDGLSGGSADLKARSIFEMLPDGVIFKHATEKKDGNFIFKANDRSLTWGDLQNNSALVVLSATAFGMEITPNNGWDQEKNEAIKPLVMREGDSKEFWTVYNWYWLDWVKEFETISASFRNLTVVPNDTNYEPETAPADKTVTVNTGDRAYRMGFKIVNVAYVETDFGVVKQTTELPVTVWRKGDVVVQATKMIYKGPSVVYEGEELYFYFDAVEGYRILKDTLVVKLNGEVIEPVAGMDGTFRIPNIQLNEVGEVRIEAEADYVAYSKFLYVYNGEVVPYRSVSVDMGDTLTLPTLKQLGVERADNVILDYWNVSGYGKYQPGDTITCTTAKNVYITAVLTGYYPVEMQEGAMAYSDEAHTNPISGAKEDTYIYITAPEVEGKQFYMWDYELTDDTYRRPYFDDATSPETAVMVPPSGIVLTPLYTTAVTEVNIYGVVQPVAGEKFVSVYDENYNPSDGIRESDMLSFGRSSWYHMVDGEAVSITYSKDVIFETGHTYRYEVNLNVPMSNEGVYDFPLDLNDFTINIEGVPTSAYTLIAEFTNKWRDYLKIIVEFTIPGDAGVTLSGTVTSFGEEGGDAMLQLIPEGETSAAYFTILTGNSAKYNFSDVQPGTYTLRISKTNHVTREYTVVVGSAPVTQDVKICLVGDVTGDGKVNMKDWSQLYNHISEVSELTDYNYLCADVTGDGKVNMKDWSRLYGHISETNPLW